MLRLRRRILLAALGALAAFGALELATRLFAEPPQYLPTFPFDPALGHRAIPKLARVNFDERGPFPHRFNSQGFRGRELPPAGSTKRAGEVRLLFLGDSFLNAWRVREEELLSAVAERELQARGMEATSFIASCSDYGTAQELMLLEEHGPGLTPDAIVLCVYAPNDVANNALELAGAVETSAGDYYRPYLVPDGAGGFERTWAQPGRAFLRRHLRSFALLDRFLIARAGQGWLRAWAPWPLRRPWAAERVRAGQAPAEWLEVFRPHAPDDPWERAWRTTEALLGAVAAEARALGARFLVLVIPSVNQVERSALTECQRHELEAAGSGEYLATLDFALPERRLERFAREAGIAVETLLGPLRAEARASGRSNYVADGHWNERGHAVAGARVAQWYASEAAAERTGAEEGTGPATLLPPPEEAPRWLALAGLDCARFLAAGWMPLVDSAGLITWAAAEQASACLVLGAGDEVSVEGVLSPAARLPTTVTLSMTGLAETRVELTAPGPFQLEAVLPPDAAAPRWCPLTLTFSRTHPAGGEDWRELGAVITGLGVRRGP